MCPGQRFYKCHICKWQGSTESYEPGSHGFCDNCGTMLYPCSMWETWGQTALIIAITLGAILAAVFLM